MNFLDDYNTQTPFTSLFIPRSLRSSAIEDILNKPELKLEDLLDEENFMFELRNSNPRLLDFFSQNTSKVKQLLDYIVVMPPNPNDNKRAYQYPLLANDIFDSDIPVIMNAFLTGNGKGQDLRNSMLNSYEIVLPDGTKRKIEMGSNLQQVSNAQENTNASKGSKISGDELLEGLFSFVKSDSELNPVLAGYFNKVVQKLYMKNQKKIIEVVYANDKILMGMANHIEDHSLSEVLSILLCYEAGIFDERKPEYFDIKVRVIEKLLNLFNDSQKPEKMAYIGDIIIEVFNRSGVMADGKEVMDRFLSKETLNKLFNILQKSPPNQVIRNVCHMILILLNYHNDRKVKQAPSSPLDFMPRSVDNNDSMLNALSENIFILGKLLTSEGSGVTISTTVGQNVKPLGLAKQKTIELIGRILKIGNSNVFAKVSEIGLINIITDMFVRFPWNNLLQNNYEKVVLMIFEKRETILFEDLIERAQFIQLIIKHFKEDLVILPRNGKRVKKGNMAHIAKFANELIKIATTDKRVEGCINRFPEWNIVVVPALKIINELNNKQIGGYHPRDLQISMFGQTLNDMEDNTSQFPTAGNQPNISSFGILSAYTTPEQVVPQQGMQNSLQPVVVEKPENFVDNSPSLRLINSGGAIGDYSFSSLTSTPTAKEPLSFGERVESLKSSVENSPSVQNSKVDSKFGLQSLTVPNSYSNTTPILTNQVSSPVSNETPNKIDLNSEKNSLNLNSLAKWDLEHSPSHAKKTYDLEDGFKNLVSKKSESEETQVVASPTNSRSLRNSMIDLRSSKMTLKIKNSDRTDGKKILEMIESYKGPNLSKSVDYTYSEGNCSESENLSGDLEFEPHFSIGFKN